MSATAGVGGSSSISSPGPAASPAALAAAAAAAVAADEIDVNREIAILKKLDHPNVVKLFEVRLLAVVA